MHQTISQEILEIDCRAADGCGIDFTS